MGDAARTAFSASIALLAGYSFIRLSYYQRFAAEYLRTDRFALHVLGYSFVFFLIGEIAAELIPRWTWDSFVSVENSLGKVGITAPVINAIALGFLLALLDNVRVRFLMRKDAAISARSGFLEGVRIAAVARFVRKSNDSALRAIFRAIILKKALMVTLKSNKVYVGKPYLLLWDDPTQALTFIKLLPIKSGYRDPDTKKVTFTTRYDELVNRLVELDGARQLAKDATDPLASDFLGFTDEQEEVVAEIDIEDLGIVISWSQVESLTIYDENLYKPFQALQMKTPSDVVAVTQ
jgi:hypothetical protein